MSPVRLAAFALVVAAPLSARAGNPVFNPCLFPMNIAAASGSLADISAALANGHCGSAAMDGDVIQIPAGTWSWVPPHYQFNSVLSVTAAVTFQGATTGGGTRINSGPQFDLLVPQSRGNVTFDHLDIDDELFDDQAAIIAIEVGTGVRFTSSTLAGTNAIGFDIRGVDSQLVLVNSTVYGLGEAIKVESANGGSQSMIGIFSSTITANGVGLDVPVLPGDLNPKDPLGWSAQVFLEASIVAGNKVDFANTFFRDAYVFQGPTLVSSDPWQDFEATSSRQLEIGNGFILGNARLGPLTKSGQSNTRTCAPLDGSQAIGAVLTSSLSDGMFGVAGNPIAFDQRDQVRGAVTSLGAVDVGQDALQALAAIQGEISTLAPAGGTASQTSVNALAAADASLQTGMNTLLADLNGVSFGALANLDATVSSRSSQASVNGLGSQVASVQAGVGSVASTLASANLAALGQLDAAVSSRASQASVAALAGSVAGISSNVDVKVSSRASQASVDALSAAVATDLDAKVSSRASSAQAGLLLQGFIEEAMLLGAAPIMLILPQAFGGQLETVQATVHADLAGMMAAGIPVSASAQAALKTADLDYANKSWQAAYNAYATAYRNALATH